MGAGKTTIGGERGRPRPAVRRHRRARRRQRGVPFDEIWAAEGEPGFRGWRAWCSARPCLARPARHRGGGTRGLDPENRRLLGEPRAWSGSRPLPRCCGSGRDEPRPRPLLAGGPTATLAAWPPSRGTGLRSGRPRDRRGRRGHRRRDRRGPGRLDERERVTASGRAPRRAYDVLVGDGAADAADVLLEGTRRVAVVSQPGVPDFAPRSTRSSGA